MTKTHGERISSLETGFDILVKPMKQDLRDIKTNVQKMSIEMPALLNKVDEHHNYIENLKTAGCPQIKTISKDNGERGKRKWDQKRYKIILWTAIIGSLATVLALFGWLGTVLIAAGKILEGMPK